LGGAPFKFALFDINSDLSKNYCNENVLNIQIVIKSLMLANMFFWPSFCYLVSGDARFAKNVKNKVFSFDLVANDPSVIACDMSKVCAFNLLVSGIS
jgi:hypothetical protein